MINQEDYTMIADYDCMGKDERGKILEQKGDQVIHSNDYYFIRLLQKLLFHSQKENIVINVTSWFKPVF